MSIAFAIPEIRNTNPEIKLYISILLFIFNQNGDCPRKNSLPFGLIFIDLQIYAIYRP